MLYTEDYSKAASGSEGESYIQRQQRLAQQDQQNQPAPQPAPTTQPTSQPAQTSGSAAPAPASNSSPVSGDGSIPPPSPAPQTAPAPAPAASAPAPQQTQQQQAIDAAYAQGLGWVDQNHPLYGTPGYVGSQQQQPAQQGQLPQSGGAIAQSSGPLQSLQLSNDPFATYQGYQHNVNIPGMNPGDTPGSYQGTQFTQFQGPNQQALNDQQMALIQKILANPETLGAQQLGQMKEQNKEAALMMQKQGMQMAQQNAAARGMSGGGGLQGVLGDIQGATMGNIISGNRDLDINALQYNRQNQLDALGASEALAGGQMQRATQGYGATLAGQGAQAGDDRNVSQDAIARALGMQQNQLGGAALALQQSGMNADEGFRQYQSQMGAQQADIQRILSQFGMNEAALGSQRADRGLDLQGELGRGGLAIDQQRVSNQDRQFDAGHGLNIMQFLEGQRQHNNNLGFNYNQLDQQGQQQMMDVILGRR